VCPQKFIRTPMLAFTSAPAYDRLKELAKKPFDLSEKDALTPARIEHFALDSTGFKLLYATERVTDEVMTALYQLAEERSCLHEMERMQDGEVINCIQGYPSENRAVLHTAVRDFFDAPRTSKASVEATRLARLECAKLKAFLPKITSFTKLVVIGIGGSELGPKALYLALEAYKAKLREVVFVGNVDPDAIYVTLKDLDLRKTLVCVVSKSGNTLETSTNEAFARSLFEKQGLDSNQHFIAITGEGSPMDNPKRYLESFYIWDWIGGRYSGSTIIGGVIISFACGFDAYWEFLKGANAMDKNALSKDMKTNLPLLGALLGVWNHNFLEIQTCAVIPYSQALWRFSAHLQQLDMESNGKQIDRQGNFVDYATGPIIWGEAGTNAQHSFYQLIHQGRVPIALEMIGFEKNQTGEDFSFEGTTSQEKLISNLIAQALALAVGQKNANPNQVFLGNRPSYLLIAEKLTPYALGALLSFYEHKVAFQGFLWNINSFDQEGVQLGKKLANKIMERIKNDSESYPIGDAYLKQFNLRNHESSVSNRHS
jgi:glucose-6-phosphate isomerase